MDAYDGGSVAYIKDVEKWVNIFMYMSVMLVPSTMYESCYCYTETVLSLYE